MHLLIGEKEKFGIELIIDSQNENGVYLGYAKLWLGGNFLGTIEDYIFIKGYLSNVLVRMQFAKTLDDTNFKDPAEVFDHLLQRLHNLDIEADSYRFSFGTMSDDFLIFAYKRGDDLVIIWKMDRDSQFSDLKNYGNEVHQYRVKQSEFSEHVNFLAKLLSAPGLITKQ